MINKKKIGIVIGVVVVAVVAGILIYRDMRGDNNGGRNIPEGDFLGLSGISMEGDGKVEIVPIEEKKLPPAPSLIRSTEFQNTLTPEMKATFISHIETLVKSLKEDPKNVGNWIMLGVNRKTIGDYEGASIVWEYVKAVSPNDIVAYNNLGDLYHFYLKDYKKSEENWKKTIALKLDYIQGYSGLVDLYKYSMREKLSEIPVLLNSGITKNPDSVDLVIMLARYYQDVGDVIETKKAYEQAIATAKRLKNMTLVTTLEQSLANIK